MLDSPVPEADLTVQGSGLVPGSPGWFVVNVAEAAWKRSPQFGSYCALEGEHRHEHLGVNVHVLEPGQPACMYHCENMQEDFFVLSGECLLLVEEQERPLKAGDFFHSPPGTKHVFLGAGEGPCAILMIGARLAKEELLYPRSELALKHGAGVEKATPNPREAYANRQPFEDCPPAWTPPA